MPGSGTRGVLRERRPPRREPPEGAAGTRDAAILREIADEHADKITVVKMNVDENPQTPAHYRVTGIPTMNVYSGGEVVKSIVGARPKAAMLDQLGEFIA